MTLTEQVITILLAALATMATRFLPFMIFRENKPLPAFVSYLGDKLPPAILGILVIYCYKEQIFSFDQKAAFGLLAGLVTIGLESWKKNMLLSILAGTATYVLLMHFF
ncbi:branched-chain amino acid transporter AzlD [Fructobacillus sp. M2-14]|uniref:Branched-chain amino acid transporter AzlD n=1 Tax=Fructobacillus broussonetiae TaxID=2713173 RepID=A0ABS5QZQ9_9LACO|nr:AzlD domain-containing protein [Fructobacillus broussonetiae]MBS9338695.1 branched-chain amino acid transporter AzlD [Fructobacillus broussonetiae]